MATRNADLPNELLAELREALDIEVKEWLDLTNHDHCAIVAKEIIALANHGGGYLIIGFEELKDGSFAPANPRPVNLDAWAQDAIQSIVAKYLDPTVQCRVTHATAPGAKVRYPIIVFPGGHRVPIRAKKGSPDNKKVVPHRIYVRRPGPTSEEPQTAVEWDRLLERCLQNRKSEPLEAMRSIMAGGRGRIMSGQQHESGQDAYEASQTVAVDALPQALPELVYSIVTPLYELFDFFSLPKRLVEEELASLQKNRFA